MSKHRIDLEEAFNMEQPDNKDLAPVKTVSELKREVEQELEHAKKPIDNLDQDYELARKELSVASEATDILIDKILELVTNGIPQARMFEVANQIIKTKTEISEKRVKITEQANKIKGENSAPSENNKIEKAEQNNYFIGNGKQFSDIMEQRAREVIDAGNATIHTDGDIPS